MNTENKNENDLYSLIFDQQTNQKNDSGKNENIPWPNKSNEKFFFEENETCRMVFNDAENKTHRYYACYNITYENKNETLTFIMFNPSNSTLDKTDPTLENCLAIAKNAKYNKVEIVNLYSYIGSKVPSNKKLGEIKNKNKNDVEYTPEQKINHDFLLKLIDNNNDNSERDFVKAWGWGKKNNNFSMINKVNDKLNDKLNNKVNNELYKKVNEGKNNVFYLSINDEGTEELKKKILHPAKSIWNVLGGIKYATLKTVNTNDTQETK